MADASNPIFTRKTNKGQVLSLLAIRETRVNSREPYNLDKNTFFMLSLASIRVAVR